MWHSARITWQSFPEGFYFLYNITINNIISINIILLFIIIIININILLLLLLLK